MRFLVCFFVRLPDVSPVCFSCRLHVAFSLRSDAFSSAFSFDFLDNSRPSPCSLVVLCVTFSGPVLHSFSSVINAITRTFYVRFSCVPSILNVIHRLTLFSNEVRLFEVRPSALFRLCKEEVADIQWEAFALVARLCSVRLMFRFVPISEI